MLPTGQTSDVLIVGAGLSGLAAAVALSANGATVTLVDRKPYVGGRAYSYPHPALHEVIDSQHVLLGCCTNLIDLCERSGAAAHIRWYDSFNFLEPATADRAMRRSVIAPGKFPLPAPGHNTLSFLRAPMLSFKDKSCIARGLLRFARGYPTADDEPFSVWLQRTRQTPRAIAHFWEPVVVASLNDTFDRCSTRYAGQVFHESFLRSPVGGRFGIPAQPLSSFFAAFATLAEQQGTALHLRCSVEQVEQVSGGLWQATAADGTQLRAPKLLLALPFEQTQRLLGSLPHQSPQRQTLLPLTQHFTHAPITTVHLWFDRVITELDHAVLLDTRIQWLFNKTRIRRLESHATDNGQYLELAISASFPELHHTRDQILSSALQELARFFPVVQQATLLKSGILKEARATFSVIPGLDQFRPPQDVGNGLYIAGDWTRTGWPSTMEGAVRSGRLAASAISGGNCLTPDMPASGLMTLLT